MSTITRGFTFSDGVIDQCSYTALHSLVDSATITNIALSEFDSGSHLNQISATQPASDQGEGSTWFDTTLNLERVKSSAGWHASLLANVKNTTGATILAGAAVVLGQTGTDVTVNPCATFMWPGVAGILTATMAANFTGMLLQHTGFIPALMIGPVTLGDTMIVAGAQGGSWSAFGTGYLITKLKASLTTVTLGIDVGMARGNLSGTSTGLVTLMLFG